VTETSTGLGHGPTTAGLDRLRRLAQVQLYSGTGLLLLCVALAAISAVTGTDSLLTGAIIISGTGCTQIGTALIIRHDTRHMTRTLRTRPWTRCLAEVTKGPWTGTRIVLRDPETDTLVRLRCRRPCPDLPHKNGPLWWSGTAAEGGVLSRPGGDRPVRATACR
jgi:hypothetical protein